MTILRSKKSNNYVNKLVLCLLFILPSMLIAQTNSAQNIVPILSLLLDGNTPPAEPLVLDNPIIFVTQFPISSDFTTIGSTFGNHSGHIQGVGRGGDLYIRYNNGSLRNLTREAGFGNSGMQGDNSIAVRDPATHWNADKVLFSMVIGAPEEYEVVQHYWQIYELTGFGQGQTVSITKVANQPANYNNITPIYGSDNSIIFTSDLPRTKNRFNYPQKDEYESAPTNTGLWKLEQGSGTVSLLQHSPSGSFSPLIDRSGRLIFTRWDHLQRDQQASPSNNIGAFNYSSELANASKIDTVEEVFPEPRTEELALLSGTNLNGHRFNHFFPWQINQDGTEEETLNHIGRHELHSYFDRSMNDDNNLIDSTNVVITRPNTNSILNTLMLDEDPNNSGRFIGIEAPEFGTHSGGQIIALDLPIGARPDLATVEYITHESTRNPSDGGSVPLGHIGFSRDPITLSSGVLLAAHTSETRNDDNEGTRASPQSRYDFRLKIYVANNAGNFVPSANVAALPNANISYYDPDQLVSYQGPLWQLQPIEVASRPAPPMTISNIESPEQQVFDDEEVNVSQFQNYLRSQNLAVVVMRDTTTRDSTDKQQPYNLKVSGEPHQSIGSPGLIYHISHMQFLQGDQIRGSGGLSNPDNGQRVIAQYMHDSAAMDENISFSNAPPGSAEIYPDGSVAFFVPARRAMAWQSLDPSGTPVVRERYWITFQPGEVRACGGCHGVNDTDQAGQAASVQSSDAFRALLQHWKNN